ncbi:hypothetical protein HDV00_012724 [Rhizophlyctis rosea]|nr:hypothetical protein HDV00_012724 [Rhizophlyctis rosea]
MVYGIYSLSYLLLEQSRFQIIKGIMPYSRLYDYAFMVFTIGVWTATIFVFGVVDPINTSITMVAVGAYCIYGLMVDNVLSFTFLHHLYKNRQLLHRDSNSSPTHFLRVTRALLACCTISWMALTLFMTAAFLYTKDNIMRTLLFRIVYSLAPVQFSAALVYMYSIKVLLEVPSVQGGSVQGSWAATVVGSEEGGKKGGGGEEKGKSLMAREMSEESVVGAFTLGRTLVRGMVGGSGTGVEVKDLEDGDLGSGGPSTMARSTLGRDGMGVTMGRGMGRDSHVQMMRRVEEDEV